MPDETDELRADLGNLDRKFDTLREDTERQLEEQDELIGDLRVVVARLEGEMGFARAHYERQAILATGQAEAELEVRKKNALARIQERKDVRYHRRQLALKLLALITLLGPILATRC